MKASRRGYSSYYRESDKDGYYMARSCLHFWSLPLFSPGGVPLKAKHPQYLIVGDMVARDLLAVTQEDGLPTTGHNEQPAILQPIAFQVALNAIPPSLRGREGEREATVAQLTPRRWASEVCPTSERGVAHL